MTKPQALSVGLALVLSTFEVQGAEGSNPVDVFKELDGTWKGYFVGYSPEGEELYRIEVEQTYKTVNETTQTVRIRDKNLKTGEVVTGQGRNVAAVGPNGEIKLRCLVQKANGEAVAHDGRIVRGAEGREQIIWYSVSPGRSETFREAVRKSDTRAVYTIDGMGQYGGNLILMHGRYFRKDSRTAAPEPPPPQKSVPLAE